MCNLNKRHSSRVAIGIVRVLVTTERALNMEDPMSSMLKFDTSLVTLESSVMRMHYSEL